MRVGLVIVALLVGCSSASSDVLSPVRSAAAVSDEALGGTQHWLKLPSETGRILVHELGESPENVPPLLLVHGLGIGSRDFARVFGPLAAARKVYALDLPGFGRSPRGGAYTPERFARVLDELVTALGHPQLDVLGHSMGAAVAILVASRRPDRVRRLVLCDVAGILTQEALVNEQIEQSFADMASYAPRVKRAVVGALAPLAPAVRALGPDLAPFTAYHMLDGSPGTASAIALIQYDFGPALSAVTASTLLVWGANDDVAPARTAELLYDRLPVTRLVRLDQVGHVPMVEAPELFVALVTQFLGPVPPPRISPREPQDLGDVRCQGVHGRRFTGRYRKLELTRCPDAMLHDVVADELVIRDGDAQLAHVTVKRGTRFENASVSMTGGELAGAVALEVSGSRVDGAGVSLRGSETALRCRTSSRLLFSVSRSESAGSTTFLHGEHVCRSE